MAAGGYLPFVLFSCPVLNNAAPVVQTAGGCWCICEPMYRGLCIGSIYPTLLEFGGIQVIILSYRTIDRNQNHASPNKLEFLNTGLSKYGSFSTFSSRT